MSFSVMLDLLKQKSKGSIVLVKLGAFYVAVGEDAVILNQKLNLKCTCFKKQICKVGFPINSLEEYIQKLEKQPYSYVIYDYDKQVEELTLIKEKVGRNKKEKAQNINCMKCKGVDKLEKIYGDNQYISAFVKLVEKKVEEQA